MRSSGDFAATSGFPGLPSTSGGFGYQDARLSLTQTIYDPQILNRYRSRRDAERASALNVKDSRDVVVFAVGLLPRHFVADLGCGPVVVFDPAFQAGRKSPAAH